MPIHALNSVGWAVPTEWGRMLSDRFGAIPTVGGPRSDRSTTPKVPAPTTDVKSPTMRIMPIRSAHACATPQAELRTVSINCAARLLIDRFDPEIRAEMGGWEHDRPRATRPAHGTGGHMGGCARLRVYDSNCSGPEHPIGYPHPCFVRSPFAVYIL